ncbi:unnamed protein product [Closterium sp. NIES-53]
MVVFHVPKEKRGKLEASGRWGVHLGLAKDHKGWLIWDLTSQQLTVSRDVKFLESLYYKEWKQQQQQKLPTTPLIIEADEVQRPSRQVQVTVSEDEISGVTEDGGEPEVEEQQQQEQQQQQQDAPQGAARPANRPRRDVRPPNRLTYPSFGKPKVVRAGSVAEHGPDAEKWKQSVKEEYDTLLENETWELCELPPGKKAIFPKLIFRHKYGPDGELTRYKSRLVAKGFQQTKGKDFDEIFAPVGKGTTLRRVEEMLEMQFKCSKMGDVKYYLGMHVERDLDKGVLRLHQRKYCEGLAEKYGLQDGGKPATPLPSGFSVEPCADEEVVGESDRKLFNSLKADGTSIGGYVCLFGGGAVSWRRKKQNEVGQSSCETEYMALHHGANEVVWLRHLLEEIGVCQKEPTVIFCDNESAVKLAKNTCLHGLTKHIRPKWHWGRRLLDKEVRLEILKTHQLAADILTKRLAESGHWKGMKLAGMSVH